MLQAIERMKSIPGTRNRKREEEVSTMLLQITTFNPITNAGTAKSDLCSDGHELPQQINASTASSDISSQDMSVSALADQCIKEINKYRRGETSNDKFGLELFHRALMERDTLAWEAIQQSFNGMVLHWLQSHSMKTVACRFDSEENYVAQTFTRFWVATVSNQGIEFRTLAAVLRYLHASLNGAILDTLRTYSRPHEVPLPESHESEELVAEDRDDANELWEAIKSLIPDERQQRVAYLLFYCHLKPREILQYCPQEFCDIREIYRLRRNIMERLLRRADLFRWRLNS